jgi:formate-dependent nitrite reductase cytochrome c552 subunit
MNKISKKLITKDHPDYETIGDYIHSKESVVGIDARHTHIAIIKKLTELEEKLDKLLAVKKKKVGGKGK